MKSKFGNGKETAEAQRIGTMKVSHVIDAPILIAPAYADR